MRKISFSAREKRKEVLAKLEKFGLELYEQLEKGMFPSITMPSRSTDNIYYSPELRQYVLETCKVLFKYYSYSSYG
ncbi:MAG: hypothetical protein QXL85_08560 [Candidatus Bathyarchaeia archaeon]